MDLQLIAAVLVGRAEAQDGGVLDGLTFGQVFTDVARVDVARGLRPVGIINRAARFPVEEADGAGEALAGALRIAALLRRFKQGVGGSGVAELKVEYRSFGADNDGLVVVPEAGEGKQAVPLIVIERALILPVAAVDGVGAVNLCELGVGREQQVSGAMDHVAALAGRAEYLVALALGVLGEELQ